MPTVTCSVSHRTAAALNQVANGHAVPILAQKTFVYPVSLGITDEHGKGHLIEATRALGEQLKLWGHPPLASVLLTHAHFGHVDGLGLWPRNPQRLCPQPLRLTLHAQPH